MNAIDIFKLKLNEKIMEMVKKEKTHFLWFMLNFSFFLPKLVKRDPNLHSLLQPFVHK